MPFKKIFNRLYKCFGPQHWWPAKTKFEVIVGAILTQNTSWNNVKKAIKNLRKNKCLTPQGLNKLSRLRLASLIKPAGFFNLKAQRLKYFLEFFFRKYRGNLNFMSHRRTKVLRQELLGINGLGLETVDSILLYAFKRPVFVVDAYTRRILQRHNIIKGKESYQEIQDLFMSSALPKKNKIYNEFHALFVKLAKVYCKKKEPLCDICPLKSF